MRLNSAATVFLWRLSSSGQVGGYVDCMVKHRRAQHTESGRKHSLSPDTRLTTRSNSAKRRRLHDATLTQASELVEPLRRRSSRQTVREQTNASELTAAARRARQPPAAGSKHRRSSGTLTQPVAGRAHRTADTPSQEQQQQVPEVSSDSRLQHPQAKSGVPNSTANTQQAEVHCELTSRSSIERSQQCTGSGQKNRQDGSGSTAGNGDQHAAQSTASAQPSQQSDAPASDQSVDDFAFEAQAQTPDSPRSEVQQSPKGTRRRAYGQRTHGTPHPTFQGVKTSTAGVKHVTEHPDVKQIWSAFVMVPSKQKHGSSRMLFLGKNYWSAEAAARAVDRANIALYGREAASTNFPLDWYGPEVHSKPITIATSHLYMLQRKAQTAAQVPVMTAPFSVALCCKHACPCTVLREHRNIGRVEDSAGYCSTVTLTHA